MMHSDAEELMPNKTSAAVLGDYLYVDGGKLSQLVGGKPDLGQRPDPTNPDWGAQEYVPGTLQSKQ